jgi:hypothetical protein
MNRNYEIRTIISSLSGTKQVSHTVDAKEVAETMKIYSIVRREIQKLYYNLLQTVFLA